LKRKHQIDFETVIDSIIDGSPVNKIIAHVTPGGGKSALPIIAGKLKTHGLVDKLLWICLDVAHDLAHQDIIRRENIGDLIFPGAGMFIDPDRPGEHLLDPRL